MLGVRKYLKSFSILVDKQRAVGPRLFSASGESLKTNPDLPSTSERVGSPRNADGNRKGRGNKGKVTSEGKEKTKVVPVWSRGRRQPNISKIHIAYSTYIYATETMPSGPHLRSTEPFAIIHIPSIGEKYNLPLR